MLAKLRKALGKPKVEAAPSHQENKKHAKRDTPVGSRRNSMSGQSSSKNLLSTRPRYISQTDSEKLLEQGVKLGNFFNHEKEYLPDLPDHVWEAIFLLLDDMSMVARVGTLCRQTRIISLRILMSYAPKSVGRHLNRDVWDLSQYLDSYVPSDPRRHIQMLHYSSSPSSRGGHSPSSSSSSSLFGSAPLPMASSMSRSLSSSMDASSSRASLQDYYPSHPFWTQPLSRFRAVLCGDKKNGQMAEMRFLHGELGSFYCLALDRKRRRLFQTAAMSCIQCCTVMDKFFRVTHGDFVVVFKSIKRFDEGTMVDSTDDESGLSSDAPASPPIATLSNSTLKKEKCNDEDIYVLDADAALEFGRF